MFEKIYLICNPLTNSKDWISEREFKIGSEKLKNVFGVLYLRDLTIMLQYNIPFKDSIKKKYELQGDKYISLHHVCWLISKEELYKYFHSDVNNEKNNDKSIYPAFPPSIELKDGYYNWDFEQGCYTEAEVVTKV